MNVENITEALNSFRSENGTHWKKKLKELFFSGKNNVAELQQFRNYFDFESLDKIKYHTSKREIQQILENSMTLE